MSIRRRIAGLRPEEIKTVPRRELVAPTSMADFQKAIGNVSKSVSAAEIIRYEKWMAEFGSSIWL